MTDTKFYAIVEFEDGLQIIPSNWFNESLKQAVWPNFTNNKRYDKAVKLMEEPEPTWCTHAIRKVYGKYLNYGVARQKLKLAEEESDLTSNTEKEEYLKKSRKIRAAKVMDDTMSSNDESSDELSDEILLELPKIPNITHIEKPKIVKNAQNAFNNRNVSEKCELKITKKQNKVKNRASPYSRCIVQKGEKADFHEHCIKNSSNSEECHDDEADVNSTSLSGSNLNYKEKPQFKIILLNVEQCDNEIDDVSVPMSVNNTAVPSPNNDPIRSENFQRFVVRKIIDLELKINSNIRKLKMIYENQKLILEKLSNCRGAIETKEKEEEIDIFLDFPLKEQQNLDDMETKLQNDILSKSND